MSDKIPEIIITNETDSEDKLCITPAPDKIRPLGIGRWLTMMRSKEYTQLTPGSDVITEVDLSVHNRPDDMWMALPQAGKLCVFDVSQFAPYHPGGIDLLLQHAGTDASEAYRLAHSYVNVDIIGKFRKGFLQRTNPGTSSVHNLFRRNMPAPATRPQHKKPNWNWRQINDRTIELSVYFHSFQPILDKLSWMDSLRILARWVPPSTDPTVPAERGLLILRTLLQGVHHKIVFRLLPSLSPELPSVHLSANPLAPELSTTDCSMSTVCTSVSLNLHDRTAASCATSTPLRTIGSVVESFVSMSTEPDLESTESFIECTVVRNSRIRDSNYHLLQLCWPSDTAWMPVPIGHHVLLRLRQRDGQWVSRPYTPVCDNFDFATHPGTLSTNHATTMTLMVKVYPDGQVSQMIQRLHCGSCVYVSPPIGQIDPNFIRLCSPVNNDRSSLPYLPVFMLAGGSGITPVLRPLEWLLCHREPNDDCYVTIHMIWFNRTVNDVAIKHELDELCRRMPTRLSLMYVLSEPAADVLPSGFISGSISESLCRSGLLTLHLTEENLSSHIQSITWLICGPLGFNDAAVRIAKQWGASEDHVFVFKG